MDINNFNDYLIYQDGRVYSKKTNIFMKSWIDTKGYLVINLSQYNIKKKFLIHRLIAEHYLNNPDKYPFVDHIDRNPLNNNIENLRWCNRELNNQNTRIQKNNKLGHKNICIQKKYIKFSKSYNHKNYRKLFKSLTDALCYKYIFLLKIKSNII